MQINISIKLQTNIQVKSVLRARTLSDVTLPIGKIHPFSKIAVPLDLKRSSESDGRSDVTDCLDL